MYLFNLHTTSHDLLQILSKVNATERMNLSSVLDYDQHVHSLSVDRVAPGCGRVEQL